MSASPPSDANQTLTQFGLAVVAMIVGSALLFFAIGKVGATEEPTSSGPQEGATTQADTETTPNSDEATPTVTPTDDDAQVVTAPTDGASGTTTPGNESSTPGEPDIEPPAEQVAPAEVSLQVLDAIRDGGTTARDVADKLEADGYDLVAYNRAGRDYDETTVFYSSGREGLARQVAADNGWTVLRANDVGLSEDVDVHVVVGTSENQ